jgi:acyl transferase domain-containing protein
MVRDEFTQFVEISPHPVLTPSIEDGLRTLGINGLVRPVLRRDEPERRALMELIGALYVNGQRPDWRALSPIPNTHLDLPTYPWQRERFWFATSARRTHSTSGGHPLLGRKLETALAPDTHIWESMLSLDAAAVSGRSPASRACRASRRRLHGDGACRSEGSVRRRLHLEEIRFEKCWLFHLKVRCECNSCSRDIHSESPVVPKAVSDWSQHARGMIGAAPDGVAPAVTLPTLPDRIDGKDFYTAFASQGMQYGETFRGVAEVWRRDGEALARLSMPEAVRELEHSYTLHPALLDACLQVLGAAPSRRTAPRVPACLSPSKVSTATAGLSAIFGCMRG